MSNKSPATLRSVKAKIKTPFIDIEGTWKADESEQSAAWELYIELITRISVEELKPEDGLLREALSSLYALFIETRKILRKYGPSIAKPKGKGKLSFGYIAVVILNSALRPVLAYWHPLLLSYEYTRKDNISSVEHESKWERNKELRDKLNKLRETLKQYADLLAQAAGIPPIEVNK
ncbi:MAG: hypothetical protein KKA31_06455 [Candidatus Margulisbacteria bacterium]|nr:hypothetical protein [Candidatus Margulisiibacteriota bacterium]